MTRRTHHAPTAERTAKTCEGETMGGFSGFRISPVVLKDCSHCGDSNNAKNKKCKKCGEPFDGPKNGGD